MGIGTVCATSLLLCCVILLTVSGTTQVQNQEITLREESDDVMDISDFSIYYDLQTNKTIKKMMPRPWYWPGWMLRLPFTGGPCVCTGLQCSCCTGIRVPALNFDRQTCTNFIYEPTESIIEMEVQMNNASVYKNSFSARNTPPLCIPIPVQFLPPGFIDMCIRLFDVRVADEKLHVCMDIDTRVDKAPVLILHFDCMDMGLGGVSLSKPTDSTNSANVSEDGSTTQEPLQLDSDVFDPVTELVEPSTQILYNNSVKYI